MNIIFNLATFYGEHMRCFKNIAQLILSQNFLISLAIKMVNSFLTLSVLFVTFL
jgi:hypothetical protein